MHKMAQYQYFRVKNYAVKSDWLLFRQFKQHIQSKLPADINISRNDQNVKLCLNIYTSFKRLGKFRTEKS